MRFILWIVILILNLELIQSLSSIDSITDVLKTLLRMHGRPANLLFLICNHQIEFELFRNLTSNSEESNNELFSGGKFKDTPELDNQLQDFITLDINCPIEQLISAFKNNHYSVVYARWLIVDSEHSVGALDEEKLLPLLSSIPIGQGTDLYYLVEKIEELRLKQAYRKYRVDDSVVLEDYGSFFNRSVETFQDLRDMEVMSLRRRNMEGVEFDQGISLDYPESLDHLDDFVDVEVDSVTKNSLKLTSIFLKYMNALPRYLISKGWGGYDPKTKIFNELLGDLQQGKAELSGSCGVLRGNRWWAADFASYGPQTGTMIVFRAPKLSYTTNVFLLPFDHMVWVCSFIVVVGIILLLLCSTWNEWNVVLAAQDLDPDRDMLVPKLSDVAFMVFGNICVQGSPVCPRSTAGRIIMLSSLIFIVFLYVSYTAFIVALLQSSANNIKTISDLIDSGMEVGNQDTLYHRFWLKNLIDPWDKILYEKRIKHKDGTVNFYSLDAGIERLQEGLFAFHFETPVGYRVVNRLFSEHEKCDLRELPFAGITSPHFFMRKHSHFKELFRILALRIKENGSQGRLWTEGYAAKPKCSQQGNFMPLALMDVRPVLYIYLAGMALSIFVLAFEIVLHRYGGQMCGKHVE